VTPATIVIPVRLVIGTRVLQSSSRALDMEGLFVRCVEPPLPGVRVHVRLYLPDGPPEDVVGRVEPERVLREVGCRVQFTQLTPAQRERLGRLVVPVELQPQSPAQPRRSPSAQMEMRALPRIPVQLRVRFENLEVVPGPQGLDLSAGGMFVRCDDPPGLEQEVQLLFELPGDARPPLACRAQVVRRVTREEARFPVRSPGVGVQFIDADDSFRERLDAWLARAQRLPSAE